MLDHLPDDYHSHVIDDVRKTGETVTIVYGGRTFGGVVRCLLDTDGVEEALRPGTEMFVRYHTEETGAQGQIAHIIIRHPRCDKWAEIYSDDV